MLNIKKTVRNFVIKSLGLSDAAIRWLSGGTMPNKENSKPSYPYGQVELVFACVEKLISAISGLPLVLSATDDKIVESGPFYEILFNNPVMSFEQFITETVGHYALSRDVFWVFTEMEGLKPKEVMVVSGLQMKALTNNGLPGGTLIGWEFNGANGEREKFSVLEVHQIKNFNPYDKYHGIGPLTAGSLSINYSYASSLFNSSALANGAEPGIILTAEQQINPEYSEYLLSQFEHRHAGAGKAKKTALLTGGLKAGTIAMNMVDMQVAELSEKSDKKICAVFGVPPQLVGLVTEAQYSAGPAQRDFIFNAIIPLAAMIAGHINSGIGSRFYSSDSRSVEQKESKFYRNSRKFASLAVYRDACQKAAARKQKLFAWFDSSQHPAVQEQQRETAEKVLKFTQALIPVNQLIRAHDLPYEELPWGDEAFTTMGTVPVSYILEAGVEGITGPALPQGEEPEEERSAPINRGKLQSVERIEKETDEVAKDNETRKRRIWRNWVSSWLGLEREYHAAMRSFFHRQQRELTDKLKKAMAGQKAAPSVCLCKQAEGEELIMQVQFDLRKENGKLRVINHTFFRRASELGIRQGLTEVAGLSGAELNQRTEQVLNLPAIKGKLVISTTKLSHTNTVTQREVANQLREGLNAGEGLNDLTKRIGDVLGSSRARAQTIARTQISGAVGTGRHEGLAAAGLELHGWLSAHDDHVRKPHQDADKDYADGIPVNQKFKVGDDLLMYPADPAGSAANIVNCRCVEIAIAKTGKTFDYSNVKFYSYEDLKKDLATKTQRHEE